MPIPFRLAVNNAFKSPLRWTLTFLATFVAFMLYTVLNGVVSGLDGAVDRLSDTRLRVLHRTGPLETLPVGNGSRIANLDGVRRVTHATLLGGYYQDLSQPVTSAAVDLEAFLDVVPEIRVPRDRLDRVLASRTGAIVGSSTANRFGWRLGDRVPVKSAFWINDQGHETWTFNVLAIANSHPEDDKLYADGLFFDYAYFNESRAAEKDTVGHFVVALEDPARAATVAKAIDGLFANSSHPTRALSEKQWISGQLRQLEDLRGVVELVLGAVFFSLLFLTGTMMVQAARSRRPEFGILKAMGFSDGSISMMVLTEAFVVCVGGRTRRPAGGCSVAPVRLRVRRCPGPGSAGRRVRDRHCVCHRLGGPDLPVADGLPSQSVGNSGDRREVMPTMREILHITAVSLRGISARSGESAVVAVGIACVVFVLVMTLGLAASLADAIATTGHPDRAVVLRNGAVVESLSSLGREDAARLRSLPGVARQRDGDVAVSPEVLVNVMLDDVDGLVLVRGLTAAGFELRPEIRVVEGRMLTQGRHELAVGQLAQRSVPSLAVGSHLTVGGADWRVVGVFESGGGAHESELLADGPTLMAAVGRNDLSSATVQLLSAGHFEEFGSAVAAIRGANLKAERESDHYAGQAETMSRLSYVVAYVVGAIMAFGATCGALNMTYSAVDARTVEVATLRAIGFGAFPVTVSVLVESALLAIVGALAGALLAWTFVDGTTFAATQYLGPGASVNHLTLRLNVAGEHMVVGVVWACAIGLIGALLPAVRAASKAIARGLQAV